MFDPKARFFSVFHGGYWLLVPKKIHHVMGNFLLTTLGGYFLKKLGWSQFNMAGRFPANFFFSCKLGGDFPWRFFTLFTGLGIWISPQKSGLRMKNVVIRISEWKTCPTIEAPTLLVALWSYNLPGLVKPVIPVYFPKRRASHRPRGGVLSSCCDRARWLKSKPLPW